jgi:hypothetical protein
MFGLFNLSGGEIILVLASLFLVLIVPAAVLSIIFLVIRATRRTANQPPPTSPSAIPGTKP